MWLILGLGLLPQAADLLFLDDLLYSREETRLDFMGLETVVRVSGWRKRRRRGELWRIILLV